MTTTSTGAPGAHPSRTPPIPGTAPIALPGTFPPAAAALIAKRLLNKHSPHEIAEAVEILIDVLDLMGGDAEAEDATDAEDDFAITPMAKHFTSGPGCEIADQDAGAWIEWQNTHPGRRGQQQTGGHEDDEEDDDAGQCTEDEISYGDPSFGRSGAGCVISDPGGDEHDGRELDDGY